MEKRFLNIYANREVCRIVKKGKVKSGYDNKLYNLCTFIVTKRKAHY
jgi:hypothetical protein